MNYLKGFINFIGIGLILISLSSCSDSLSSYLHNEPKDVVSSEVQWASETSADLFLNDIYGSLPNYWNSPENLDNFTDDNDVNYYYTSFNWKKGIVNPSSSNYTVWGGTTGPADLTNWGDTYRKVRKCNTFIQQIKKHKENYSEEWFHQRLDEARFLRAYFYSEFFTKIGGIPIITKPLNRRTMGEDELYKERATFKEFVDFLTSELTSIVQNGYLEVKYGPGDPNAGRATLGAALMLKGWIQLFAASPAFNASVPAVGANPGGCCGYGNYKKSRWQKAAKTFKKFINKWGNYQPYGLYQGELGTLWYGENEYHSGVIWDRQIVPNVMGSSFEQYGGPVWVNGAYYTWGNYNPTQELVDAFFMANGKAIDEPGSGYDPQNPYANRGDRFYAWIVYDGAYYYMDWMSNPDTIYTRIDKVHPKDNEIDFGTDDVSNTGYFFKKKLDPDVRPGSGAVGDQNYIYYRYAEVLLGYAEAKNEWSGPDPSVYRAINKIRNRAGLPDLEPGLTQDEMRQAIHQERRVELSFEQKRYYDIIRWVIADSVLSRDRHGMKITNTHPQDNSGVWHYEVVPLNRPHTFNQRMYLLPVPQKVLDRNPKIKQNPGY